MSEWLPGTFAPKGDPVVNLVANSSFEKDAGTVEVRRNLAPNADFKNRPGGVLQNWMYRAGSGGAGKLGYFAGGVPSEPASDYAIATVTTAGSWYRITSDWIPVEAGATYALSGWVNGSNGAADARIVAGWRNAAGTVVDSGTSDTPLSGWGKLSVILTAPADAVEVRIEFGRTSSSVGERLRLGAVLFEKSPVVQRWFSSTYSPDVDLTPGAVGVQSVLTGVRLAGVTTSQCVAIRSTQWAKQGRYSMRLIPTNASTTTYAEVTPRPMTPSAIYTQVATVHLEAPLSGTLRPESRRIGRWNSGALSPAPPNTAGEHDLRLVNGGAGDRFMFWHGGSAGSGDVWWDLAALIEGDYTGPAFTGDDVGSDDVVFTWAGERNNSPSIRQEMEAVMATIFGTLTDFGLQSLAAYRPVLKFTPSGPGVKGRRLFSGRPVQVTVASNGNFAVLLEPTDGVTPEAWYTVSIEYLNEGGQYTSLDILGYRLYVPAPGGQIGDMPGAPASVDTVLVSLAPPPPGYKGWYLNAPGPGQDPGDPDDPASSGTGILEIVR